MSALEKSNIPTFQLSGRELILIALGMIGFVLFFLTFPGEHPDSTVAYTIDGEEAADRARTYLASQGFILDAAEPTARLRRDDAVLGALQNSYGRRGTVNLLDSTGTSLPAAYKWNVRFRHRDSKKEEDAAVADLTTLFDVDLTLEGDVYSVSNHLDNVGSEAQRYGSSRTAVNRTVLAAGLVSDTASTARIRARLRSVPDSTLRAMIAFESAEAPDSVARPGADVRVDRLSDNAPVLLGWNDIVRMAQMQINHMAFADLPLRLDSLDVRTGPARPGATLEYGTRERVNGQHLKVTLNLTPTGNLSQTTLTVNPESDVSYEPMASEILTFVSIGGWTLLALVIIVVFFRRMIARLIDVKSAMLDSMLIGLIAGGVAALGLDSFLTSTADIAIWLNILLRLLALSVIGGAVALFAFMVSGVADSLGREIFPRKVRSLALMRHGDFRNRPVGSVLLRGISAAGLLLGLIAVCLMVRPDIPLELSDTFSSDRYLRPVLAGIFGNITSGYFLVLMILVGIGGASSLIRNGPFMFITAVTLAGAVLQIIPLDLASGWWSVLFSGLFALVLGGLFLQFDLMTVFVAFATSRLLLGLSEGFLVTGSPAGIDLLLGVLFLVTLLVIGAVGVASGRTERDLREYVPDYVTEMASQERVKRELELAHQVQASFLPRTMPHVSGLDLAGMCLPANEVGGDYFDFIPLDDRRLAFVVGDVSGKGIHAAFFMTLVKGMLQTLSRENISPARIMQRLNHLFCLNAPAGVFISMIYGVVDSTSGEFCFARAGHNPAILCRAGQQSAEFLQPNGMAIGFADGEQFDSNIEESTITLRRGDALVFYTDGFSEAMNSARDLYGDERLARKVGQVGTRSANAILRSLTEDVHHFIEGAGRSDDMTMVVLKLDGQS